MGSFAFSDVLCPNVRVEGDRFKHTNGDTDEIPGKETHFLRCKLGVEKIELYISGVMFLSVTQISCHFFNLTHSVMEN